jgi:hypothetical protein
MRVASRATPHMFERATCWASPPRVTADVTGLLAQVTVPPWDAGLGVAFPGTLGGGGELEQGCRQVAGLGGPEPGAGAGHLGGGHERR